jgi:hypothetical protein
MGDLILWMGVGLTGRVVRVSEPLACWRRHPGAATSQVDPDHAREHVLVAMRGLSLPGLGPQPPAVRAEALRNACLVGLFWAGGAGGAIGRRFTSIDLHRPRTSAVAAGLDPGDDVGERAAEFARLWRQVARSVTEAAELRAALSRESHGSEPPPGSGVERAIRRLESIGALPGEGEPVTHEGADLDLRAVLAEAAADCGSDIHPETSRFLLVDRQAWEIPDDEHRELSGLAFSASRESLRSFLSRQEQEVERLRGRMPSLPATDPGA